MSPAPSAPAPKTTVLPLKEGAFPHAAETLLKSLFNFTLDSFFWEDNFRVVLRLDFVDYDIRLNFFSINGNGLSAGYLKILFKEVHIFISARFIRLFFFFR